MVLYSASIRGISSVCRKPKKASAPPLDALLGSSSPLYPFTLCVGVMSLSLSVFGMATTIISGMAATSARNPATPVAEWK